jgi:hypothetical protein
MFDGDGAETLELQAFQVAKNSAKYRGSRPCPTCGIVMDPVQFMYSKGVCPPCFEKRSARRVKGKMI